MAILEMRGICKDFPGVRALDRVDLSFERGEIHALCGENGAGKSTLMKILSGVYPAGSYEGELFVEGGNEAFGGITDAEKAGIAIIPQELSLVMELSVAENLFLGREPLLHGFIDKNRLQSETAFWLAEVGLPNMSPEEKIGRLGIAQQQLVEIAKALAKQTNVLILDEPTSALSEDETNILLGLLSGLKEKGVSLIYISHKLREVFRIADRITVLRDGKRIDTLSIVDCTEEKIIALMVGRELTEQFPPPSEKKIRKTLFELENWSVYEGEKKKLQSISFAVGEGEIVGIAGLMGAGRTELFMSLFGAWGDEKEGVVRIDGRSVELSSPREAIKQGVFLVTEDRKRFGLVLEQGIEFNLTLSILERLTNFLFLDEKRASALTRQTAEDLRIKAPSLEAFAGTLSGGNQQKVVLGKGLLSKPKILLLDEPTRGIDVGAKYEIYRLMRRLADQGIALIMVSSELPEVLGMSDRVLVMREGRLAKAFERNEATPEKVMQAATGSETEN